MQSEQKLLETEALLQSITNELQELKSQQNKNNLLKSELPELLETKQILQNKIDAFSEYLDLAKLQGSLSAETEKILQEFNSAQSDFLQTEKFLNELKAQNIALQLSPNLKQGEPCPVCGSTEHPVLAHAKSDSLTIAEKINLMSENLLSSKKNFDFASAEKTKIEERTAILTENLKKATVILLEELENIKNLQNIKNIQKLENIDIADLDLVSNVCSELQNQKNSVIEQIEQINAKTLQFNNLDESISQKEKQSSILEQNIPSYKSAFEVSKTMIQNLTLEIQKFVGEQEFSAISIDSEYQKTKNDVLNTESTILNLQTEQKNASTEYTKAVSDNQNSSQFFAERQSEAEQAKKTFETAIKESVFGSEDFVTMAILTESQEQTLQNAVSAWNEKFTSLKALISNSKIDYTTELFEQLNNQVEHFSSKLILLQSEQDEILNNLTNAKSKLDELVALKEQYDSIYAKKSQIQQNYELHLRLSNALSGTNPKKTTFDAWYLSLFLDEIAQNASQRLYQMSGRFKMRLGNSSKKQGYKGLDLEIFDCATGVYCSTESLSGGETFMASLSLALALTDTVQSKKGGVQLDCLFIDEGFGSLDGTKLDNAIKILDEIRENRIVGIISHVSELKNQMQNILEVVKQPQGNSTVRTSLQTL